ncbi:MAG: hypothetical protein AAFY06_15070 [Pseudomonadota bacterium]
MHKTKKATSLGCTTAKKNPGVQEGVLGLHVSAGDAIADPWFLMAVNGYRSKKVLQNGHSYTSQHR